MGLYTVCSKVKRGFELSLGFYIAQQFSQKLLRKYNDKITINT